MENFPELLYKVSVVLLPVVLAITLHEAAHGFVALRLGDDTAYRLGRVSFNPLRHIDPFGTIILPGILLLTSGFLFGYAKPVPVNFQRLHEPRRDMVWVALAGPGTNLVLAFISALLLHLLPLFPATIAQWLADSLQYSILINLVLAIVNMLPLPPLDGGRVAVGLLPDALAIPLARTERYGILILLAAFLLLPVIGRQFGVALEPFEWLIGPPVDYLFSRIMGLAGFGFDWP